MIGPIRQPQDYHRFADTRAWAGIENAADVLSSLALLMVGVWGVMIVWRKVDSLEFRQEAWAYWALFAAVAATGVGSAYYHLAPDDARLVWDRLPIALAFMALLSAVLAERVDARRGARLLAPLLVLGAASVAYWAWFDDLRFYGLVQYGGVAAALILAASRASRYTHGWMLFVAGGLYALAKAGEVLDREVFAFTQGMVSGHTLKHLLAAAAIAALAWALERRRVLKWSETRFPDPTRRAGLPAAGRGP